MAKVEAEDPQTVPHNGLELREAALWAPVPRSGRGAARRLGQRLIHSRAFRRASHTQLSARHPGQSQTQYPLALPARAGVRSGQVS